MLENGLVKCPGDSGDPLTFLLHHQQVLCEQTDLQQFGNYIHSVFGIYGINVFIIIKNVFF